MQVARASDRRESVLAAVAILLFAVGSMGPCLAAAQGRQETLVIARGMGADVTNDPHRDSVYGSWILGSAVYDTLVTLGGTDRTKVEPRLATDWDTSKDSLIYRFKLRPGMKFASGNPITAEDVRFSLRRLKHLREGPAFLVDGVREVEVVDPLTVRIVLGNPNASFLSVLATVPCSILDSKTVVASGGSDAEDAKSRDKTTGWFLGRSAGSGPYRLIAYTKDVEAVLERNPAYWGPRPHFAKVIIRDVKEGATRLALLQSGEADAAYDVAASRERNLDYEMVPTAGQIFIGLTNRPAVSKALADARVRRAVSYGLDYERTIAELAAGGAVRSATMIPPGLLGADGAAARMRDMGQARRLLAEAGHGSGVTLRLTYASGWLLGMPSAALAARIQKDLADVGVSVALDAKERSAALAEIAKGASEMYLSAWTASVLDSSEWVSVFYADGVQARRVGYAQPRVQELAESARRELLPEKRERAYREIARLALEDLPFIPLLSARERVGYSPAKPCVLWTARLFHPNQVPGTGGGGSGGGSGGGGGGGGKSVLQC